MSDQAAEPAASAEPVAPAGVPDDRPHPDDRGAVSLLQLATRDDETDAISIYRFRAYTYGLGTIGARGYFRVDDDGPWAAAAVDWIGPCTEGTVYVIHRR